MANLNPSPSTRWPKGVSGNQRAWRVKWLHGLLDKSYDSMPFASKLNLCLRYGDVPLREALAARLLEIAFTDRVVVIGRDEDGPIERVSSYECIDAIKTLMAYDLGKPREMDAPRVSIPEHVTVEGRPLLDIIADVYRHRLLSGEMTETELHKLTELFLSIDRTKIALLLKLLGGKVAGKSEEEIRALLAGAPLPERQEPTGQENAAPSEAAQAEERQQITSVNTAGRASAGESLQSHPSDVDRADGATFNAESAPSPFTAPDDEDDE